MEHAADEQVLREQTEAAARLTDLERLQPENLLRYQPAHAAYDVRFGGKKDARAIAALFDLQSLSREDFLNSRMLEMRYFSLTGVPFVDGLLSEDSVLPDNVEGGIGFVSVRSVSRAVCDFGERELPSGSSDWPLE